MNNTDNKVSMICGIISLITCILCCGFATIPLAIVSIVLALSSKNTNNNSLTRNGKIGVITSIIAIVLFIVEVFISMMLIGVLFEDNSLFESKDTLSNKEFITDKDTIIEFNKNKEFKMTYGDSCVTGTYKVYNGQKAIDKVSSIKELGLTETEVSDLIEQNTKNYCIGDISAKFISNTYGISKATADISKSDFYCIVLHGTEITSEEKSEKIDKDMIYIGYYIDEIKYENDIKKVEAFDLLNVSKFNSDFWEKVVRSEGV